MALSFFAALILVAVVIHIGVALVALLAEPRGRPNAALATFFGLLAGSALAFGLLLLSREGSVGMDAARALHVYTRVRVVLEWPGSLFVLALAAYWPYERWPTVRGRRTLWTLFATFGVLWGWVFLDHGFFYGPGPAHRTVEHWHTIIVDDFRFWVTSLIALWLLGHPDPARVDERQMGASLWLFTAFAVGTLSAAPSQVVGYAVALRSGPPIDVIKDTMHLAGLVVLSSIVLHTLWRTHRLGHDIRAPLAWLSAAAVVGVAATMDAAWLQPAPDPVVALFGNFGSLGHFLVRPLLVAYAMLAHGFLGITARLRQGLVAGLLLLTAALTYLPIVDGVRTFSRFSPETAVPLATGVGLAVVLVIVYAVQTYNERVKASELDTILDEDARQLGLRRRTLYKGALQLALAGGVSLTPAKEVELREARARLGIGDDDHRRLFDEVVASVLELKRSRAAAPGTLLFGRYRIEEVLGEGGSGRTYRCHDTTLDRALAVKEIDTAGDPGTRRRALREARTLAKVHDPHVIGIHDVLESAGNVYLVTELARGGSLADRIRKAGRMADEDARVVLGDVLAGLEVLHQHHVVHRDIKPSNVLLDPDRGAMVADLGIAHAEAEATMTRFRQAGTPTYMAPEQLLDQDVDARTDIYAAAALLYEMLTGETYVHQATKEGILVEEAIVSRPPPELPSEAPSWARRFVAEGLQKDPSRRPVDCGAAHRILMGPGTA